MAQAQAKAGDKVKVHYTGRLDDGRVFDSSEQREPLELTLGEGRLIPGFEEALTGMAPGDDKRIRIPANQAYGPHRPELVLAIDRGQFPEHIQPQVGQQLEMKQGSQSTVVTVAEVSDQQVTLDANHPLAGQDLTFDVQLVEIAGAER